MRTIVIGDIHGCYKALRRLLDAAQPSREDQLIFLGDYVDRGPDSCRVLDLLVELKSQLRAVFLLGNHEIMMRQVLSGAPAWLWLQVGGYETVSSYGGSLSGVPESHRSFLEDLLPYYESDSHLYLHANYDPHLEMDEQPEEILFWRHLTEHLPEAHHSGKHAICGHTPQAFGQVGYYGHLTCLDTGCSLGYFLTAMEVETGRIWQSDSQGDLIQ